MTKLHSLKQNVSSLLQIKQIFEAFICSAIMPIKTLIRTKSISPPKKPFKKFVTLNKYTSGPEVHLSALHMSR